MDWGWPSRPERKRWPDAGGLDRSRSPSGSIPSSNDPNGCDGRAEVAVRIPAHDFLRAVLQQTGVLVVTSANRHGAPTPRTADDVAGALGSTVELIIDGGELQDVPSTLVNVSGTAPSLEREGAISQHAIHDALHEAP